MSVLRTNPDPEQSCQYSQSLSFLFRPTSVCWHDGSHFLQFVESGVIINTRSSSSNTDELVSTAILCLWYSRRNYHIMWNDSIKIKMKESGWHIPYTTKFSLCDFSIITFITFMFRCVHVCVCAHLHTSKLAATGKLWVRKKCPSLLLPTFRNQINVNIFWKLPLQYIFEKKNK